MLDSYQIHESGALIRVPSSEELRREKLDNLILAIYNVLTEEQKTKIDIVLLEGLRNV